MPSELARGVPLPKRAVMITFDDGYSSCYDIAFPLLQEYQAKAVIKPDYRSHRQWKPRISLLGNSVQS